jgi:GAF domain-containing protein
MPPARDSGAGRAILDRQTIRIDDLETEPGLYPMARRITAKSLVAVPLMRRDVAIGALVLGSRERGGFSDSQIKLLETFAEQAMIAITSAETYRALQTRTSDLQETLEYQTAISDVLKVISRSAFDLQPVLDTVVETAARLCYADQAAIFQREGESLRLWTNFGFPPEYEAFVTEPFSVNRSSPSAGHRSITEGRPIHIHDVTTVPGYHEASINLGKQRTTLGIPLMREGATIGAIVLARQHVEPFTDRQIELVSTFADQAVIAIENTRLMTEQREALEQQTATADLLQTINSSLGDLTPVFDAMLDKALRAFGAIRTFDGEALHQVASRNLPPAYAKYWSKPVHLNPTHTVLRTAVFEHRSVQIEDMATNGPTAPELQLQ